MSSVLAHLRYFVTDAADEWRHSPGPNLLATATLAAVLFVAGMNLLVLANLKAHVARWKRDLRVSVYLVDDARGRRRGRAGGQDRGGRAAWRTWTASTRRRRSGVSALPSRTWRTCRGSCPRTPSRVAGGHAGLRDRRPAVPRRRSARRRPDPPRSRRSATIKPSWIGSRPCSTSRVGAAAGLGLVVLTAVAFVVSSVLRLTVYARRDEIDIMRLVGAGPMLVRGPFLVAGIGQGLVGGLLALFFVEAVRRTARAYVGAQPGELLDLAAGRPLPFGPSGFVLLIGTMLGLASAWFAVRQAGDLRR